MSPRTRHSLAIAAVFVALAAIAGIAAIEGWLPESFMGDTPVATDAPRPRIAGTAPPESLSPGESIVTEPARPAPAPKVEPAPAPPPPAPPAAEPARKPAPKTPTYARAETQKRVDSRRPTSLCGNCGTVASTTYRQSDRRHDMSWEIRVKFDDGTSRLMRFPTDPGFRVGDRVFLADGRLHKDD